MNHYIEEYYDVIVVGAGHAGCEAALACARLGLKTLVFTVSVDSIALMPCNPNIGGTSKGHLVCELDALGGEMGKCIDDTFIQSKMLNKSKGPAVHSLRAQADKMAYIGRMRKTLENTENLRIKQGEVAELVTEPCPEPERADGQPEQKAGQDKKKIAGVKTTSGAFYLEKKVILCTGVYLNARCIYGEVSEYTGPNGLRAANQLTASLMAQGIPVRRFKTGTPVRIHSRSVDFDKMEVQEGDDALLTSLRSERGNFLIAASELFSVISDKEFICENEFAGTIAYYYSFNLNPFSASSTYVKVTLGDDYKLKTIEFGDEMFDKTTITFEQVGDTITFPFDIKSIPVEEDPFLKFVKTFTYEDDDGLSHTITITSATEATIDGVSVDSITRKSDTRVELVVDNKTYSISYYSYSDSFSLSYSDTDGGYGYYDLVVSE